MYNQRRASGSTMAGASNPLPTPPEKLPTPPEKLPTPKEGGACSNAPPTCVGSVGSASNAFRRLAAGSRRALSAGAALGCSQPSPLTRFTITLCQPTPAEAELVISADGTSAVYPLTLDQIRLLASQIVKALVGWPEARS
jgi:hypothetical protein